MAQEFEHTKPTIYSTVDQIEVLEAHGPWTTKSGSKLWVRSALSLNIMEDYFQYDPNELVRIPEDFEIRGFRQYTNIGMPVGNMGGGEFHRIRKEMIFGLDGETFWECEDLNGDKREFILTPEMGIKFAPFIMHTYQVRIDNSGILVVANTLFDPDDPRTYDTYSREIFTSLQSNG